jgi:uncharacterized protein (DUF486 family)
LPFDILVQSDMLLACVKLFMEIAAYIHLKYNQKELFDEKTV